MFADVHLVVLLATTGDLLEQAAVGELFVAGDDDFRQRILAGDEGGHVAALDEPDFGFVGAAADLLGAQNLKQLRVKGALVQQEGQPSAAALFGAMAHGVHALSRGDCTPQKGRGKRIGTRTNPFRDNTRRVNVSCPDEFVFAEGRSSLTGSPPAEMDFGRPHDADCLDGRIIETDLPQSEENNPLRPHTP